MRKIIGLLIVGLLVCGQAFAAPYLAITPVASDDSVNFLIRGTATIYTDSMKTYLLEPTDNVGLMYRAQGSTVNLKLDIEQSFAPPTTEGSTDQDYVTTDSVDSSITVADSWKVATLDTVVMPYMRFKVSGQGSNSATTTLEIKVSK